MQKPENNTRRFFLKSIPVAIASFSAFAFFKTRKSVNVSEKKYKIITKSEADEIIKNEKNLALTRLKPAPAPVAQKNING
jgi:hypothetical protein